MNMIASINEAVVELIHQFLHQVNTETAHRTVVQTSVDIGCTQAEGVEGLAIVLHRSLHPMPVAFQTDGDVGGVIVSFQQIDTVAAGQAVASPMPRLGM